MARRKRKNSDLQNTTHKAKDRVTPTSLKTCVTKKTKQNKQTNKLNKTKKKENAGNYFIFTL
jgi:hypothetical protein